VFILLAMMATAFMGYALPWGQMGFWGVTVITNLFSALDSIWAGLGTAITEWLWGGYAVTGVTLNRFFSLHYLLPFVIFGLVVLHIWALHVAGQNNPTGLDIKSKSDSVPMYPYAVAKDAVGLFAFLIVFAWFVLIMPDYLGHADNFTPANPLVTPPHIVPEWYFLPFYAILRAVPDKLGGVIAMFAAVLVLVFVPWLDTSRVRSAKYRPYYKIAFWFFVFTCIALGWLGSKPAEQPYVFWSQFFTVAYFAFFLVALPVLGLIETPKQLPRSITESVLGRSGGGGAPLPAGAAAAPEKR
jgi:ubiquinol-cytochrome c reductase cytochrome b/c1 subunit